MSVLGIFSRGGQIRGLRTKVPQRGPGMEPQWGLGAKTQKPTTGSSSSSSLKFLEWPKQQRHHEDHEDQVVKIMYK